MKEVRVGIIGVGVMGSNHARVARQLRHARLTAVVDADLERATSLAAGPDVQAMSSIDQIAGAVDLAVVAVPTAFHLEVALQLIELGIHVLVEKPIAGSIDDARRMIEAADAAGVSLSVGHVERFNAAVMELPELLDEPLHLKAVRVSPYSPRISDGVVHDLMIHDLDIALALLGEKASVESVSGVGRGIHGVTEDLAHAVIKMSNGVTASFETSRLGQQKVRLIEVTQRDSVVVADLLRQDITVHKMSRHEYLADDGVRYRQSSVVEIPFIDQRGEPLLRELQDVVDSIREHRPPRVDGANGLRALELADRVGEALVRS
jgi:predicted dehydrogenase